MLPLRAGRNVQQLRQLPLGLPVRAALPRAAQVAQQKGMAHFLQSRRAQFRLHRIPMRLEALVFQHTQIHVRLSIPRPLTEYFSIINGLIINMLIILAFGHKKTRGALYVSKIVHKWTGPPLCGGCVPV